MASFTPYMYMYVYTLNIQLLYWICVYNMLFCYIGECGRKAGCVKPFDQLSKQQLEQEFRVRDVFDFGNTKKELTQSLKATLQGVQ